MGCEKDWKLLKLNALRKYIVNIVGAKIIQMGSISGSRWILFPKNAEAVKMQPDCSHGLNESILGRFCQLVPRPALRWPVLLDFSIPRVPEDSFEIPQLQVPFLVIPHAFLGVGSCGFRPTGYHLP